MNKKQDWCIDNNAVYTILIQYVHRKVMVEGRGVAVLVKKCLWRWLSEYLAELWPKSQSLTNLLFYHL